MSAIWNTAAGSGFVHTVEATPANVHDVTAAAKLLREDDEAVYGDSAYLGLEKRDEIKHDPQLSAIEYRISCRPGKAAQGLRQRH
ncbi:transposase [uncultured Intestinimonas sp.]|uniref:transposase n=1 Tax=uncultured Intestinimonas sp. TaxID=1689265 RepID=UPI00343364C3